MIIQTQYNGYKFRSRLEARWAVFMDSLGVKYEYEKEGFEFRDGIRYLPDFWLPELEFWVEIKGEYPNAEDQIKASYLAAETERNVYILYGDIPSGSLADYNEPDCLVFYPDGLDDHGQRWCECPVCGRIGIRYDGQAARLPCACFDSNQDKVRNYMTPRLVGAYRAARSARFEYGELPLTDVALD